MQQIIPYTYVYIYIYDYKICCMISRKMEDLICNIAKKETIHICISNIFVKHTGWCPQFISWFIAPLNTIDLYLLVIQHIAIEHYRRNSEFSHETW